MPECDYCDTSFDAEDAYLDHLRAEHRDELGRIDRRRLSLDEGDGRDGLPTAPIVLGLVVAVAAVAVGLTLFSPFGGGSTSTDDTQLRPTDLWSVHYHGTIEVVVDGQRVDFSRDRYQSQADAFHFEEGDGSRWHVHARQVTLGYAMSTLGIEVTESTVTLGGTTYRDSAPSTAVTVTVNGESVTPEEYVLQDGDRVRIVVERS